MNRIDLGRCMLAFACLASPQCLRAQPTIRVGREFQVNSFTESYQANAAVAVEADGDFVVAWSSSFQDGYYSGIFARRFNSAGLALAAEFQVNSYTRYIQDNSTVALDSDGDFVIAWVSDGQDGSDFGVFARRFGSAGMPVAIEFQVNSHTVNSQLAPAVAFDPLGGFLVAWMSDGQDGSSDGIFARHFNGGGVGQAVEFQVNSSTANAQRLASLGFDGDGDLVVVWQSTGQDGSGYGIFGRRFNAAGVAQAVEFQVNSYTQDSQFIPAMAVGSGGDFVVAWFDNYREGYTRGVFARRFDAAGVPQATEFHVNSYTLNAQAFPEVAVDDDGDFVVVWSSEGQDGSSYGVFARQFSSAGVAQAVEFQVNTYTTNHQRGPAVALDHGDFVVAWFSIDQDGSGSGVFAQRFATLAALDIDGDGQTAALTDGLLVLRYLFGFSDGPLVASAVDAASCTRCAAQPIEAYLQNLSRPVGTIRVGSEFQVNSFTALSQYSPAVASDADGDFVIAWASARDGSYNGIFARRFNSAGVAQAAEFQVNSYTTEDQTRPALARDAAGDFVVAWRSLGQDGASFGVFARRFNSAGVAQAAEFQVSSFTVNGQYNPVVDLDASGDFVIAWNDSRAGSFYDVFARRFNAAGVPQAAELQVNSFTPNPQLVPSLALDADGDFVVAWQSLGQDGANDGIFARRFNSAGVTQAGEFEVNSSTPGYQFDPTVAIDADGDFVVAWSGPEDNYTLSVFAQRFSAAGVAQAAEFRVNSYVDGNQRDAAVALDGDGDFVVVWSSLNQDGSNNGIFGRLFDAAGVAQAAEFQVNSYTTNSQDYPAVTIDAGGDFVVAWQSLNQDGSSYGVFAQRFATLSALDIDGDGETAPLTDGLLVLRYLFGFTGPTLVTGAVDAVACTRCTAPAIEAYLQALK